MTTCTAYQFLVSASALTELLPTGASILITQLHVQAPHGSGGRVRACRARPAPVFRVHRPVRWRVVAIHSGAPGTSSIYSYALLQTLFALVELDAGYNRTLAD